MAEDLDALMAEFDAPPPAAEMPEAAPSNEQLAMLANGMAATTAANLFNQSKEHVQTKLSGAKIVGRTRMGSPAYDFKEICQRLARPSPDQVIEYVKKMRPNDLPPIMQDAFWNAQNKKLKFERDSGELFRMDEIEALLAEVFKNFRMGALLFADTLARETGLTPPQRKIVETLSDDLLAGARTALLENDAFEKIRSMRELSEEQIGTVELPEVDEPDETAVDDSRTDRKSGRRPKAT